MRAALKKSLFLACLALCLAQSLAIKCCCCNREKLTPHHTFDEQCAEEQVKQCSESLGEDKFFMMEISETASCSAECPTFELYQHDFNNPSLFRKFVNDKPELFKKTSDVGKHADMLTANADFGENPQVPLDDEAEHHPVAVVPSVSVEENNNDLIPVPASLDQDQNEDDDEFRPYPSPVPFDEDDDEEDEVEHEAVRREIAEESYISPVNPLDVALPDSDDDEFKLNLCGDNKDLREPEKAGPVVYNRIQRSSEIPYQLPLTRLYVCHKGSRHVGVLYNGDTHNRFDVESLTTEASPINKNEDVKKIFESLDKVMDKTEVYLWALDRWGNVIVAPEEQRWFRTRPVSPRAAIKHGDLLPLHVPSGRIERGHARAAGEIVYHNGKWYIDSDSSFSCFRKTSEGVEPHGMQQSQFDAAMKILFSLGLPQTFQPIFWDCKTLFPDGSHADKRQLLRGSEASVLLQVAERTEGISLEEKKMLLDLLQ